MKKIERVLLTFSDKEGRNPALEKYFFGIAKYLEYKLNLHYDLQKVQFLNIHFRNKEFFTNHPNVPREICRWEYGIAEVSCIVDFSLLENNDFNQNNNFIWTKLEEAFLKFLELKKSKFNIELLRKFFQGKENFSQIEVPLKIYEEDKFIVKVQAVFDPLISCKLTVFSKQSKIENHKHLFNVNFGAEYFIDMIKTINIEEGKIIINGKKDAKIFPIIVPIDTLSI